MIGGKSWEYWAALLGMALYAIWQDAKSQVAAGLPREPVIYRMVKYASSGLLAFALTPTVAPWLSGSDVAAAVIIMGCGATVLDMVTALLRDRDFIKDVLRAKLGARKDEGGDNGQH